MLSSNSKFLQKEKEMKKIGFTIVLLVMAATGLFAFDGYVEITNNTGFTIYYIQVSHESDEYWGDDMLGDETLIDGDTYRVYLTGHASSIFDIRVEDEDGDSYTFLAVDVEEQDVTVTLDDLDPAETENTFSGEATINGPGGEFDGYVEVTNNTGFDIYYLKIRQNSKSWGPDLLGDEVLLDAYTFTVNLKNFPSSILDVRLEDEEGDTYTFYDVDVEYDDVYVTLDHLD